MNTLKVIEKNDQRVITSAQLAEAFGTDLNRINYNFNYNKARFTEGKHYFTLTGQTRKEFINEHEIHASLRKAHTIYLWTEKGAFLHAKSLNTNKAWEAYENLVDDYFNKTEQLQRMNIPTTLPTTVEEILLMSAQNMINLRNDINEVREENRKLKLVVDNEIVLTKNQKAEVQQAVDRRQGELNREGYTSAHFQGIYKSLKTHFNVPTYSDIKRTDFDKALKLIAGWYPKKAEEQQA